MALRRPLWPRTSLTRLSAIHAPRRLHSAPLRRATQATAAAQKHQFAEFLPPRDKTELDDVLRAIQAQDHDRLYKAFLSWTDILADPASEHHDASIQQAQALTAPTFSEILRSIDPIRTPDHDVAHGLNITAGQTQFTDAHKIVDDFGVRGRHRNVLQGLQTLMAVRKGLTANDFEVCLRCAGVAADYQATKAFWAAMANQGLRDARTSQTWTEFIKARFVTEPAYYQFDRARVAVMARDLYSNRAPVPMATLKRMDGMRLSLNALQREPWNRRRDEPEEDIRRLLRRRVDYRGFKGHWIRALYYGTEMDEELLCASLVAFARSSSLHSIKTLILQNYYGISVEQDAENPGHYIVSGGVELPIDSPVRPTSRLLNAIVDAFGAMSHVPLAMKLVDFVSQRYEVPIPAETWSNLLNWTYLCASKPFKPMRRLHGDFPATTTSAADVREVWAVMTSSPYNVEPTFDDYDIYIKTLLAQRSLGRALDLIRNDMMPYYEKVVEKYHTALEDEILISDTSTQLSAARRRRHKAATYKDYVHHRMSSWFGKLLKTSSANRGHRTGAVMRTLIPDLVHEFADFFPHQIRYRTSQGVVQLTRPTALRRFEWESHWRTTLPQKKAGIYARDAEGSDEPDFTYPSVDSMRVVQWQRVPRKREKLGKARDGDWWAKLEHEMLM